MKKIKEILIFIGILIISYMLIQYSHIRFSIADDYLLNNIISGTFGNMYDYQMLYINNILGIILKGLYEIIPKINIYTLYLITTLSICYMLIVRDILKHKKYIWIPIVFMLYLLTLYNITYTIIAYLSIAVGILELSSKSKKEKIVGFILIISGCLLRSQAFLPVFMVLVPAIILRKIDKKEKIEILKWLAILGVYIVLNIVGNAMYSVNNNLSEFKKWQDASIKIRDYASIDYDQYREIFEKENWTENDLKLFYSWNFADKEKFSTESMENIANSVSMQDRYNLSIPKIIKNFIEQYTKSENKINDIYIVIFVITFIVALIKCENKKSVLYVFLATIGINILLIIRQRTPYRVIFPQYLIAIIYFIFETNLKFEEHNKLKKMVYFSTILITLLFSITYINKFNKKFYKQDNDQKKNESIIKYLEENQENLYILDSSTYNSLSMDYKITNRKKIGEYKNIIKAGGGDCFSNRYYSCLKRYNLKYKDNLYKNLTENNVFYIGEINDVLRCYLKENVDENADFSEDTKVDGRIIYKFKMFK